ncbi:hypothetical protein NHG32_02295 [Aerococcaceae bacterium NML191219]|nr:hypothetical protein [Aerococcaceae bacterium NML191219]
MRKILSNKVYDTGTAKKIGYFRTDYGASDFRHYEETLYKKRTGEYFLHGEGNGLSPYAGSYGDMRGPGEKIVPLAFEEARDWAERKLESEEYEKEFGTPEEEGTSVVFVRVSNVLADKIEKEKAETGISQQDIVVAALEKYFS